ncbi:MAG: hypothetical protein V1779_12035 [bacterium]
MRLLLYICLSIVLLTACAEKEQSFDINNKEIILMKIVQNFEGDSVTETEIYEYTYERPSDKFWNKANLKDGAGEDISITTRKLDTRTRMPIEEYVEEMDEITESYKVIYSANTGDLLLKEEFEGNFNKSRKIKSTKYDYINGVLISRTVATYSNNPKFVNKNNANYNNIHKLRFFTPMNTRPPGNFESDYYFEYRNEYEDNSDSSNYGKIIFGETTEFDNKGFPIFHSTTQPGCAHEGFAEWFDYKLDKKGRIISLKAYDNELKTKRSQHSSQILYTYDKHGYINTITDKKYSQDEGEYTKFHDLQVIEWLFDKNSRCYDFNFTNEHYCFTGQRHSLYEKKVSFDGKMKKVVSEYYDAYSGEYKTQELHPKLFKKTTYIYAPIQ